MINLRSKREISLMRVPGLVVWEAHQAAAGLIRPGVTTAELDDAVEAVFQKHDAIPLFKGVPGRTPFPAATCISVNDEVVHGIPGSRVLQDGDIVSLDTGCKIGGWCGDAAITHAVGQVSKEAQHLLDVTKGTLQIAIDLLPKKERWSEIAQAMQDYVEEANCSVVTAFVGHGIGREMHEDPQVPNFSSRSLRGSGDFIIQPGLVIAIEPMVNMGTKRVKLLRDQWTQITADRRPSAHFEHTVAITDDGPVALTKAPTPTEAAVLAG